MSKGRETWFNRYGAFVLVATVCAGVGLRVLGNGFVNYDDPQLLLDPAARGEYEPNLENLVNHLLPVEPGSYMPLRALYFMACYVVGGSSPFVYHLVSLLLYTLLALLVYLLAHRLLCWGHEASAQPAGRLSRSNLWALFAALLFCVSPQNVECLAWVSASKDLLLGVFWTACVVYYIQGRRGKVPGYKAALVCFILALASKPAAIMILPVILAYELCRPHTTQNTKIPFWIYFLLALVTLPFLFFLAEQTIFISAQRTGPGFGSVLAGAFKAFFSYLIAFFVPVGLSVRYLVRIPLTLLNLEALIYLLLFAALCWMAVLAWRAGNRLPVFALVWVVLALLPTSGIVPLEVLRADRYALAALPMYAIVLSACLRSVDRKLSPGARRALSFSLWLVPLIFSALFIQRLGVWKSSERLWNDALAEDRKNYVALKGLGAHYSALGDTALSIICFQRALTVNPASTGALTSLGSLYEKAGEMDRAELMYRKALEVSVKKGQSLSDLGSFYLRTGRLDQAEDCLMRSLEATPGNESNHYQLSVLYQRTGRLDKALAHMRRARDLNPRHPMFLTGLGRLLAKAGYYEQAIPLLEDALARDSLFVPAYLGMGELYGMLGSLENALGSFETALRLEPDNPGALRGIAGVLGQMGNIDSAAITLDRLLKLDPDDCDALSNMVAVYLRRNDLQQALTTAQRAIACDSLRTANYFNCFQIYYLLDSLPQAKSMLERVLKLAPGFPAGMFSMARLILRMGGERQEAVYYLQRHLQVETDSTLRVRTQSVLDSISVMP